jgi:hypothetical protein
VLRAGGAVSGYPLKALAKRLRRPVDSLLAQSSSTDPYSAGVPYRRVPAEWFAKLYHALKVRPGSHVRRILYLVVSQQSPVSLPNGEPFENTEKNWGSLCNMARDARYLGLIPASTIIDRRNPEPVIYLADEEETPAEIGVIEGGVEGAGEYRSWYEGPKFDLPSLSLEAPVVSQRYHLETWCEKSTMNDVLLPFGQQYGVNIITGVGEMSATACEAQVNRARRSGRPVRILYVSDFDPGGQSMPLAAARKIEFYARGPDPEAPINEDIQVIPVVLTQQQCIDYRLPRTPIKESERRAAKFEARFGAGATELDALEALHPGELRRILVGHVHRYYDVGLDDNVAQAVSEAKSILRQTQADITSRHAEELKALEKERKAIAVAGQAALETVWNQIAEKEKAFAERARPILEAMTEELKDEAPDIDDFDWPEAAEGAEHEDPLFDSTRSYVDQIRHYHQHQGKTTEVELWQDRKIVCVCARCSKEFPASASRKQAKVCSAACRLALKRARRKARRAEPDRGGHPDA